MVQFEMLNHEVINFYRVRFSISSLQQAFLIEEQDMRIYFFQVRKFVSVCSSSSNKTNLTNMVKLKAANYTLKQSHSMSESKSDSIQV